MIEMREEKKAGGWREIAVRVDGQLYAVITHPCYGGKWVAHFMGLWASKKFRTRKEAVAYVMKAVEEKIFVLSGIPTAPLRYEI